MNHILNRELLSFALSSVPIGLSIWNPISQRLALTKIQADLHDIDLNVFDGRLESFLNVIHSNDVHNLSDFLLNGFRQHQDCPIRNYRVIHQNQSIHWIQISTCWRSRSALFMAAQDITESRMLGTTVITQAWQHSFLFEEMDHIAFTLGRNARISNCSQAAQFYLGIERCLLLGRSVLEFVHPDDRDVVLHLIQNLNEQTQRLSNVRVNLSAGRSGLFEFCWFGSWRSNSGTLLLKPQPPTVLQTNAPGPIAPS